MKIAARILSVLLLSGFVLFSVSCDSDDGGGKSETDTQLEKLQGTWVANSVKLEGQEQDGESSTLDYSNFQLAITTSPGNTEFNYTTTGRPAGPAKSPWPASGVFAFGTPVATSLIRKDDNISINYSVSDTQLTMSFTLPEDGGFDVGRDKSVTGDWEFVFTKQ